MHYGVEQFGKRLFKNACHKCNAFCRCSPVQFAGTKRYRDPPCTIEDLPKIDAVVISHNHYDHLDTGSVKKLNERFGSKLRWYVPAGTKQWMECCGCQNVVELNWWEENNLPGTKIVFAFTPSQHWCKRGMFDYCKVSNLAR